MELPILNKEGKEIGKNATLIRQHICHRTK